MVRHGMVGKDIAHMPLGMTKKHNTNPKATTCDCMARVCYASVTPLSVRFCPPFYADFDNSVPYGEGLVLCESVLLLAFARIFASSVRCESQTARPRVSSSHIFAHSDGAKATLNTRRYDYTISCRIRLECKAVVYSGKLKWLKRGSGQQSNCRSYVFH